MLKKRRVLLSIWAIGAYFFTSSGNIILGNSVQQGINSKGVFLLNQKTTFEHFCAPCHGETGAGDGRYYPSNLIPGPRDFTDAEFMNSKTDEQLFVAISEGSAAVGRSNRCPPWGRTISREKINEIITYLRSLGSNANEMPIAEAIPSPELVDTDEKHSTFAWEWIVLSGVLVLLGLIVVYQRRKK